MSKMRGNRSPSSVWLVRHKGARGTSYRIRWIDPATGQTRSQSAGTDYALARSMKATKSGELLDGLSGKLPDKSIGDLVNAIGKFMAGRSKGAVLQMTIALEQFRTLVGDRRIVHVGREAIVEFRQRRLDAGVAVATVNKALRQIKSALSYAVDAGWLQSNPLLRWRSMMLPEPDKFVRVVEPEQVALIIDATPDPVLKALIVVAYFQGMRRTELSNLRWSAVNLANGTIHVVNRPKDGEFTKTRRNRTLPMHPATRAELIKLRALTPTVIHDGQPMPKWPHVFTSQEGRQFLPDYITRAFGRAADAAGIMATLHDLRRSFSTNAQRAGVDRSVVKDLGGWSSVRVLERHYTGDIKPALQRGMETFADALPSLRPSALPGKAEST